MNELLSVCEAARILRETPKRISDLFYRQAVPLEGYPVIGARRVIPRSRLAELRKALAKTRQQKTA